MLGRHDGYWSKTTLHYRGWSAAEISGLLRQPDLLDYYDDQLPPGRFYAIQRVLAAEAYLASFREVAERCPRLPVELIGVLAKPIIKERIAA